MSVNQASDCHFSLWLKIRQQLGYIIYTYTSLGTRNMIECGTHFSNLQYMYPEFQPFRGWSGGAMVLGKFAVPGRPTILIRVGQGPTALAVGAGGGCLDIFTLIYLFSPLSPSLWETARYRLKYCLKGLLNPKQPTNQSNHSSIH